MLTQEQVAERVNYIGGSDAAAVLGLSRYKTRLGLWAEKTGAVAVEKKNGGELPIWIGDRLEDVVAERFTYETGIKLQRVRDVQVHPRYPFLRAQIDRVTFGQAEREIVECKTASAFKAGEWGGEDVPSEYIVQVMHQLMVLGAIAESKGLPPPPRAHLACLIGGNVDFVRKYVDRDEDMIRELEAKEVAFWSEHVLGKKMPAPAAEDDSVLQALFPKSKEEEADPLALDDAYDAVLARIAEIGTEKTGIIGDLLKEQDALKNEVKAVMGDSPVAVIGGWNATWKTGTRVSVDTKRLLAEKPELVAGYQKTTTYRTFAVREAAKKGGK